MYFPAENKNVKGVEDETLLARSLTDGRTENPKDSLYGWIVTMASFVNHCIIFGVNLSFGVIYVDILDYYSSKRGETAGIGSILIGACAFISPVSEILTNKCGPRVTTIVGALLTSSGFIFSYFVNSMDYLFFTYGFIIGAGVGIMFLPSRLITFHYMHRHRSLSVGLSSAGVGLGTIMFSTLFKVLLDEYGLKGTFLITGGIVLNGVVCGALFRPVRKSQISAVKSDKPGMETKMKRLHCWSRFRNFFIFTDNKLFYVFLAAGALSALATYLPFAHLPRLARDYNFSEWEVASLVPMMCGGNIAGRLLFGWIGDFNSVSVVTLWSCSTTICGICIMLFPVFKVFYLLPGVAVIYGMFVGVWGGLKAVAHAELVGTESLHRAITIVLLAEGASYFAGSPLAGWLYDVTGSYSVPFYSGGAIVIFSGAIVLIHKTLIKYGGDCTYHKRRDASS